mgnify:CR=1 FL=1
MLCYAMLCYAMPAGLLKVARGGTVGAGGSLIVAGTFVSAAAAGEAAGGLA